MIQLCCLTQLQNLNFQWVDMKILFFNAERTSNIFAEFGVFDF